VGEHAGGFQAALLQAGEVTPPGTRLDRGGLLVGLGCRTHASSVPAQWRSFNLLSEAR
jgi:hypothetical protein